MKSLCQASGAGLGCGSCKTEVAALLNEEMKITAEALVNVEA
jgi:ferredoxin-nitrate reductase